LVFIELSRLILAKISFDISQLLTRALADEELFKEKADSGM